MKRKMILYPLMLTIAAIVYTGCRYDKASLVYPSTGNGCDTTNVTLSGDLNTIMSVSCFGCHGGDAAAGSGIQLQDYNTVKTFALNGVLLSAIEQDGSVTPMPQGGAKLSDCNINKFKAWINSGAPNN